MNDRARPGDRVLLTEQHGPIRWLTMNRPQRRNALDPALVTALDRALRMAERDPATRAVVLGGAGRSFCAGADLRHFLELHEAGDGPERFLHSISELTRRIELSPIPVVAALHGHVVAGGLEIALACDVVLAEAGTLIGDGHIRNHLLPAAGSSVRMPQKIGEPLARWLALSGELLPADRFTPTGWIHEIAPPGELVAQASQVARTLAAAANPAQAEFKRMFVDLESAATVDDALRRETDVFARYWASHDVPSALRTFLARRSSSLTTAPPPESEGAA